MEFAELDPSSLEAEDESRTWEDAKCSPDYLQWKVGYSKELKSLKDMQVYVLAPRCDVPQGHKIWKGHPIFKIKRDENGKAIRWKVQLVFKGVEQVYGKDYNRTTSPIACMES